MRFVHGRFRIEGIIMTNVRSLLSRVGSMDFTQSYFMFTLSQTTQSTACHAAPQAEEGGGSSRDNGVLIMHLPEMIANHAFT